MSNIPDPFPDPFPAPSRHDCVHLWISDSETQPMRCARCGHARDDVAFVRVIGLLVTIGCVMLAVVGVVVIVAQIAIYIARHQML